MVIFCQVRFWIFFLNDLESLAIVQFIFLNSRWLYYIRFKVVEMNVVLYIVGIWGYDFKSSHLIQIDMDSII
jgi:hypothetical protein